MDRFTTTPCSRCDGEGWLNETRECPVCDGSGLRYEYTDPDYAQFVEDMGAAGFAVRHYGGRWGYEGPAVVTDREYGPSEQDVYRATKVRLVTDHMGLDTVLYPG